VRVTFLGVAGEVKELTFMRYLEDLATTAAGG
jgi:hypothetical protein